MLDQKRVFITGMGVVTGLGRSVGETWTGVLAGRTAIAQLAPSDVARSGTTYAARIRDVLPDDPGRRTLTLAQAVFDEALHEAGLTPDTIGPDVIFSSSKGLPGVFERAARDARHGAGQIPPFYEYSPDGPALGLFSLTNKKGSVLAPVSACSTGLDAVRIGWQRIAHGLAEIVAAGAVESSLTPLVVHGFGNMKALSPDGRAAPFDAARNGFVVGEGAGLLVLESEEHLRKRGGPDPLAEISNAISGLDPTGVVGFSSDGAVIADVVRRACGDTLPDYVHCHGTGTVLNDRAEARALGATFGAGVDKIPFASTKGATGHLLGASGAVELALTVAAIRNKTAPPTTGLVTRDPKIRLNVSGAPARAKIETALKLAYGFGGHIAAVLLKKV